MRFDIGAPNTCHIGFSEKATVPLAVTFYVSPEIFEDVEAVPDERLADLLHPFLLTAVTEHRFHRLDAERPRDA